MATPSSSSSDSIMKIVNCNADGLPDNPVNFTDLPIELLILIFGSIRPINLLENGELPGLCLQAINDFCQDLRVFAGLRSVCRTFYQVTTPILYEEFLFVIRSTTPLEPITIVFEVLANHAKSITIHGASDCVNGSFDAQVKEVIGRGLGRCTKLQTLRCHGVHPTFTSRAWLPRLAPHLASTLTCLSIACNKSGLNLSHSLVALGPSLKSLEISHWHSSPHYHLNSTFHLASTFPNLTKLVLRNCDPYPSHISKFFSRILASHRKPAQVPLRTLIIAYSPDSRRMLPFPLPDLVSLFTTNHLGTFLTTLRMEIGHMPRQDPTTPVHLLQLCPNLLEFAYHSPHASPQVLDCLPRRLHALELAIHPGTYGERLSRRDILLFVKDVHRRTPALHSFCVLAPDTETTVIVALAVNVERKICFQGAAGKVTLHFGSC